MSSEDSINTEMEWFEKALPNVVDNNIGMGESIPNVNLNIVAMAEALIAYRSRSQSLVIQAKLDIPIMRETSQSFVTSLEKAAAVFLSNCR
jgi:hypothetical protein